VLYLVNSLADRFCFESRGDDLDYCKDAIVELGRAECA
jgi:hypothetical protein